MKFRMHELPEKGTRYGIFFFFFGTVGIRAAIKNFVSRQIAYRGSLYRLYCATSHSCRAIIVPSVKLQRNRYLNWTVVFAGLMGKRSGQEIAASNRIPNEYVSPEIRDTSSKYLWHIKFRFSPSTFLYTSDIPIISAWKIDHTRTIERKNEIFNKYSFRVKSPST